MKPQSPFYQDSASRANLSHPCSYHTCYSPEARRCGQPRASSLLGVPYLAVLAHSSNAERVFQGDVEAPTRDADVWNSGGRVSLKGPPPAWGPSLAPEELCLVACWSVSQKRRQEGIWEGPHATGRPCGPIPEAYSSPRAAMLPSRKSTI